MLVGRVIQDGRLLRVATGEGPMLVEPPRPDLRTPGETHARPVCGDWVLVEPYAGKREGSLCGRIQRLLPRQNVVVRSREGTARVQPMAANIDEGWIVCGLDRDPRLRQLSRYQAILRSAQVGVVVILNKIDLVGDTAELQATVHSHAGALESIALSARTGSGMEALSTRLLPGRVIALFGASGAGKSTIVNELLGRNAARVDGVRKFDARGRHTTTGSCLRETKEGALIIDTPGSRELGLLGSEAGLPRVFQEIEDHAGHCRFRDCRHENEPGCSVRAAIADGLIAPERFLAYLELRRETVRAHHPRRRNQR